MIFIVIIIKYLNEIALSFIFQLILETYCLFYTILCLYLCYNKIRKVKLNRQNKFRKVFVKHNTSNMFMTYNLKLDNIIFFEAL